MEYLKLFAIFKNKFAHLIAQVFIPIIFIIALDQLAKFVKNISACIVFFILVGCGTIIYCFPKLLHRTKSRNFYSKKSNKTATRFSERLKQKAGML